MTSRSFRPRYVMIGGFLGAGKTTALLRLAAGADLLINLRAEGDPALLLAALHGALGDAASAAGIRSHVQQVEHLRPAQPTPTYRLSPV